MINIFHYAVNTIEKVKSGNSLYYIIFLLSAGAMAPVKKTFSNCFVFTEQYRKWLFQAGFPMYHHFFDTLHSSLTAVIPVEALRYLFY